MPGWIELQGERPSIGHLKFTTLDGPITFLARVRVPARSRHSAQFDGALVVFWEEDEG